MNDLNLDYFQGISKNRKIERHLLQQDPYQVVTRLGEELNTLDREAQKELDSCQQKMLGLAQKSPGIFADKLKHEAAILARKKKLLQIEDCVLLFLQSDFQGFKKATQLHDEEIHELYQSIGEFLLLARRTEHIKKVVKDFGRLETELNKLEPGPQVSLLIQKIGEGLKAKSYFDSNHDPVAVLVMEYGLQLLLRKEQIEKLREILPAIGHRSIFLQMIQAWGKTLVFSTLLALLNADGEHLSVHIGATSQHGTGLYDMKYRSSNLFKQAENSFTFDDHPKYFTVENLSNIKNLFERTIQERKYVNTTIESLQALRCKYEKTMLELSSNSYASPDLEEKAEILQQILSLLHTKAIFTFDELQLALAALKELHMPFGKNIKISAQQANLIANLLKFASSAQRDGKPLLNLVENKQPQQTPEQYARMLEVIADRFLNDPTTLEKLKIFVPQPSEEDFIALKAYILSSNSNIPEFISRYANQAVANLANQAYTYSEGIQYAKQIKEAADYFVLANRMLGGQWLKKQFSRYVNEHHGLPHKETSLPISVPYLANMQPDEESQFSDQFIMILNTFITYVVEGLHSDQVESFLDDLHKKANSERIVHRELYGDKIDNTPTAQQFHRCTGLNLSDWYDPSPKQIPIFLEIFKRNNEDSLDLLFNFVIKKVLSQVQLFDHQTSSNGQNVALMAKSSVGYSASLDNLNMIPPQSTVVTDVGTNGQTIDLLIRKALTVWMNNGIDSLFEDVMDKHPEKEKIRAFADVACLFRGIPNAKVAIKICDYLNRTDSKIKVVLYFDQKTGKLLFVDRKNPLSPIVLSGTSPEVLNLETGYPPEERFTYYDQEHCTGTDIEQFFDTIALLTWGENTKLPAELQGSRRMRQLQDFQSVVPVVDKGSLDKIFNSLNLPIAGSLEPGPLDVKTLNVKHLILFSHLNEVNAQYHDENLLLCIQKLLAATQQAVHNFAYTLPLQESVDVFRKTASLFDKKISVDLYEKFAFKPVTINKEKYIAEICNTLLGTVSMVLSEEQMQALIQVIQQIYTESMETLKPEFSVSQNGQLSSLLESNPNAVMTQYQQNTVSEKNRQNQVNVQSELELMQMSDVYNRKYYEEIPFYEGVLEDPRFLIEVQEPLSGQQFAEVWNLNHALMTQYEPHHFAPFTSNIYVTSNFAMTWDNRIDLLGPSRKIPAQWLLACDDIEGEQCWRLLLCSIQDAVNFKKQLKESKIDSHRKMFLLRASSDIKLLASNIQIDPRRLEEIPDVNILIAQALLFSGKLSHINRDKTLAALSRIIPPEMKKSYEEFFKEKILTDPSEYLNSPLERFFKEQTEW